DPFRGVKVLDADRDALERARLFSPQARVASARHFKRLVRGDGDESVEAPGALHRLEMGPGELKAGNRPGLETVARFCERERGQVGQTGILGKTGVPPRRITQSLWERQRSRPRSAAHWRAPSAQYRR